MALDELTPHAGNHSIQTLGFLVNWTEALTERELRTIEGQRQALQSHFPQVLQTEMMQVQVDTLFNKSERSKGKENVKRTKSLGGIQFVKPAPAPRPGVPAVARSLNVSKENLTLLIHDYQDWAEAWAVAVDCLAVTLPHIVKGRPLTGCGLHYSDIFTWRADPATLEIDQVFRREGKLLPPSVFELRSLWHSHHGYLLDRPEPVAHQLIENVNVNVVQTEPYRSINILTSHVAKFSTPGWQFEPAMNQISTLLVDFHARNRDLLIDLLTPSVCEKIGLRHS